MNEVARCLGGEVWTSDVGTGGHRINAHIRSKVGMFPHHFVSLG